MFSSPEILPEYKERHPEHFRRIMHKIAQGPSHFPVPVGYKALPFCVGVAWIVTPEITGSENLVEQERSFRVRFKIV